MAQDSQVAVGFLTVGVVIWGIIWSIWVFIIMSSLNNFLLGTRQRQAEILQGIKAICDRLDLLKK